MRLALIGAGGRTGLAVIEEALSQRHEISALVRSSSQLVSRPGLQSHLGDALREQELRWALAGCDAVISVLGPTRDSPPALSSASTAALVAAMTAERLTRLVIVTGAMSGEPRHMGLFYRMLAGLPSIRPFIQDRRRGEQILRESHLCVTIFRPPRLTDKRPSKPPLISSEMRIRILDSCARVALARALVASAAQRPARIEELFIRS